MAGYRPPLVELPTKFNLNSSPDNTIHHEMNLEDRMRRIKERLQPILPEGVEVTRAQLECWAMFDSDSDDEPNKEINPDPVSVPIKEINPDPVSVPFKRKRIRRTSDRVVIAQGSENIFATPPDVSSDCIPRTRAMRRRSLVGRVVQPATETSHSTPLDSLKRPQVSNAELSNIETTYPDNVSNIETSYPDDVSNCAEASPLHPATTPSVVQRISSNPSITVEDFDTKFSALDLPEVDLSNLSTRRKRRRQTYRLSRSRSNSPNDLNDYSPQSEQTSTAATEALGLSTTSPPIKVPDADSFSAVRFTAPMEHMHVDDANTYRTDWTLNVSRLSVDDSATNGASVNTDATTYEDEYLATSAIVQLYTSKVYEPFSPSDLRTISEEPTSGKALFTGPKKRRHFKFGEGYYYYPTPFKTNLRRKKAKLNGWKPKAAKEHALFNTLLAQRLSEMDGNFDLRTDE